MTLPQKRKAFEAEVATEEQPSESAEGHLDTSNAQEEMSSTSSSKEALNTSVPAATSSKDRAARFAALKARASASSASNLTAARHEATRASIDPSQLASLSCRQAIASHNLMKAESDSPAEFERKRAWDWTVEESERWDRRKEKKGKHREEVGFRNYGEEAGKIYKRGIKEMSKDDSKRSKGDGTTGDADSESRLSVYEQEKISTLLRAAQEGGLEIVETTNPDGTPGELALLDRDGAYSSSLALSSATDFVSNKPPRENVDRLVEDLRKAEETRLRKRRDRGRANDEKDQDITFINDKNKAFNQKLRRFYDRYTRDIRESFERGTAI